MAKKTALVWFRQDLRLTDNPALYNAIQHYDSIYPVYIQDTTIGGANNVWVHHSLKNFPAPISVYQGNPESVLKKLLQESDAGAIYWNRCYDAASIKRDTHIKSALKNDHNVDVQTFNGSLLWEPWDVLKQDGTPYKVFTPFYRKGCLNAQPPAEPLPKASTKKLKKLSSSLEIKELGLLPDIQWHETIEETWNISEQGAQENLSSFLDRGIHDYKEGRNFPAQQNVSRLSPYLQSGEISPRTIWYATQERLATNDIPNNDADHFLSELGWREFSYSLLYHFPQLPTEPLQEKFKKFPWETSPEHLKAWQKGLTGYPIVDAGMRELWQTGWMHNRVRMIVGSFLVKHLLLHWHHGERWFWDCLVDADHANNAASWQWIAGCGADAAPYFRIFNPITQGEKFDPTGDYIRKYVPELSRLSNKYLNRPWEVPPLELAEAGITLGKDYPHPIVDHAFARQRALDAFQSLKS